MLERVLDGPPPVSLRRFALDRGQHRLLCDDTTIPAWRRPGAGSYDSVMNAAASKVLLKLDPRAEGRQGLSVLVVYDTPSEDRKESRPGETNVRADIFRLDR